MSTRAMAVFASVMLLAGQVWLYTLAPTEGRGWLVAVLVVADLIFISAMVDHVRDAERPRHDDL